MLPPINFKDLFGNKDNAPPVDPKDLFEAGQGEPHPDPRPAPGIPSWDEWDYKTSKINPNGETLPKSAVSFDPYGRPYFGPGFAGTLKKYSWMLVDAPTAKPSQADWDALDDTFAKYGQLKSQYREQTKAGEISIWDELKSNAFMAIDLFAQTIGTAIKYSDIFEKEGAEKLTMATSPLPGAEKREIGVTSPITPILRLTKVGVQMVADLFSEAQIKVEQLQGAYEGAREAGEGSKLPDIFTGERLPFGSDQFKRGAELIASLAPPVMAYNAMRFWSSPKTMDEKKQLIGEGWNAGRILYSTVLDPALREQFISRARNNEDPQLLAMELENPWAEMAGQLIFDPLTPIGWMAKAYKTGKIIDRATDVIKAESRFSDELMDVAKILDNAPDDTTALRRLNDLTTARLGQVNNVTGARLTQNYSARALSQAGNIQSVRRTAESIFTQVVTRIKAGNGSIDDIADALRYGVLSVSANSDQMTKGMLGLVRFGGSRWLAEDATESFVLVRNLLSDAQGNINVDHLLDVLKASKGDPGELAKVGANLMERAAHNQFPVVGEMRKAFELSQKGKVTGKTAQLAEAYKTLSVGEKFGREMMEKAIAGKGAINKILGAFYFNQYGYAARNAENNLLTVWTDHGTKAFFKDGKYWMINQVEDYLKGWFGGIAPVESSGFQTILSGEESLNYQKGLRKFLPAGMAQKNEHAMAMRSFAARFRETMDMMIQPGAMLPSSEQFRAAGFTDDQVKLFTRNLKANYGNVGKAIDETFNGSQEAWRAFDLFIDADDLKAFDELGITDELMELTRSNSSKEEVAVWWDKRMKEAKSRAAIAGAKEQMPYLMNVPEEEITQAMAAASDYLPDGAPERMQIVLTQDILTRRAYTDALIDAASTARRTIPQGSPQYMQIDDMIKNWEKLVVDGTRGSTTRHAVKGIWGNFYEIKDSLVEGMADQATLWNRAGMTSPMPLGMSNNEFLNAIAQDAYTRVDQHWTALFTEDMNQSEALAKALEKFDPNITDKLNKAREMNAKASMYRAARGGRYLELGGADTTAEIAARYGIATASKAGAKLDKKIISIVEKYGNVPPDELAKYQKIEDIPTEVATQAFESRRLAEKLPELDSTVALAPPYVPGQPPTPGMWWKEISGGTIEAMKRGKTQMLSRYGMTLPDNFSRGQLENFAGLVKGMDKRMTEAQAIATRVGKYWRDFTMLPYGETTNWDVATSFIMPYKFWYERTYANWMKRVASDPQVIGRYFRLKEALSKENKESPEWFKFSTTLPAHFLGLPVDHPMILNLEANLWPLYGITGVDFNEPRKRVDWFTALVDDLGKFGPSVWAPIQMAIAAGLQMKGESEAASFFGGRIIPQTATVKAGAALFGDTILELDPAVQQFSGEGLFDFKASDPYEESRTGRAIGAEVVSGRATAEEGIDAAYNRSGELYDTAHLNALKLRAPGQIMSFFAGVGFKGRTDEDVEIDRFWKDYNYVWNLSNEDMISPDQLRTEMDKLRDKYDFMDTILVGRKSDEKRFSALAYNVFSRVPPGQADDYMKMVGLGGDAMESFYDNKGDISKLPAGDQKVFEGAIINLAAMLKMPEYASRQEWTSSRQYYSEMKDEISSLFGEDIWHKVDAFYQMKQDNPDMADLFMTHHPEIRSALAYQDNRIVGNPALYKYYGSLDTIDRTLNAKLRDQLTSKYGEYIYDVYYAYLDILDPQVRRDFRKKYPDLNNFMDDYFSTRDQFTTQVTQIGSFLPSRTGVELRPDFQPGSQLQQTMAGGTGFMTPEKAWNSVSPAMQEQLRYHWLEGDPLSKPAESYLQYISESLGIDPEQLLQLTGIAIQQGIQAELR
jgi:hypothetical protein